MLIDLREFVDKQLRALHTDDVGLTALSHSYFHSIQTHLEPCAALYLVKY